MFSKGELSKILQSTQEIYLETNLNNVNNSIHKFSYNGRNGIISETTNE